MPAVLSKPSRRFGHESVLTSQRAGEGVTIYLPVPFLRTLTPFSRCPEVPKSDWVTYAAQNDIGDAEYTGALLDLIPCYSTDCLQAFEDEGYDTRVLTCWIREEECRSFRSTLRTCALELAGCETLADSRARKHAIRSAIRTFLRILRSSRNTDRCAFVCWHCREPTDPGLVCKGCRYARYCGKACQKADWMYHCSFCKKDATKASLTGWKSEQQCHPNS